jgi:predicted SPOUT superfamily RNA methylase MTH1
LGLIGRAAAIFRVDEIVIYRDNLKARQDKDLDFIALLLRYLETPQYLRKRLFKIEPRLQYAGILPPLRTPNHPVSGKSRDLRAGEYREGVILSKSKEGLMVDVGVEQPALLREKQHTLGKRLTLQVVKATGRVEVQATRRMDVPEYWGYAVRVERRSLRPAVETVGSDLVLGTSRKGEAFDKVAGAIERRWKEANSVLVLFGAPARGLYEIAADEDFRVEDLANFVVNTVPLQGSETIRTEEAILASLAVLNVWFGF